MELKGKGLPGRVMTGPGFDAADVVAVGGLTLGAPMVPGVAVVVDMA